MIIFIHGEDTYRSQQRVNQLKGAFINKYNKSGLNLIILDGAEIDLDEFQKKCFSMGLLEKKRLIIVKNLISQSSDSELLKGVSALLKENKFPKDNILIFWEGDLKGKREKKKQNVRKTIADQLKKEKEEEFEFLAIPKLRTWVQKEINKRGGEIERKALEELIAKVGQNLWQMNNEIEKLVNYCQGGTITQKDVRTFVQAKFDENVFHLTDALGQKQKEQSLKLIHDQFACGAEALVLLSKFIWQFRNLIQISEMLGQQATSQAITSTLKIHPFVVQKTIPQARRFKNGELREIYKQLLEMDFKLKNTNTDPELLFDLLVMDVCK